MGNRFCKCHLGMTQKKDVCLHWELNPDLPHLKCHLTTELPIHLVFFQLIITRSMCNLKITLIIFILYFKNIFMERHTIADGIEPLVPQMCCTVRNLPIVQMVQNCRFSALHPMQHCFLDIHPRYWNAFTFMSMLQQWYSNICEKR